MRRYHVYIMSSFSGALYVGVTGNLPQRVLNHRERTTPGFTCKYNIDRLVYYEEHGTPEAAIAREKQIKRWNRVKKELLINSLNPAWHDLSVEWVGTETNSVAIAPTDLDV